MSLLPHDPTRSPLPYPPWGSIYTPNVYDTPRHELLRGPLGNLIRSAYQRGTLYKNFDFGGDDPFRLDHPVMPFQLQGGADRAKVETLLGGLGYMDLNATGGPTGQWTPQLDTGIRAFQRDTGLKVDGKIYPTGDTIHGLRATVASLPDEAKMPLPYSARWDDPNRPAGQPRPGEVQVAMAPALAAPLIVGGGLAAGGAILDHMRRSKTGSEGAPHTGHAPPPPVDPGPLVNPGAEPRGPGLLTGPSIDQTGPPTTIGGPPPEAVQADQIPGYSDQSGEWGAPVYQSQNQKPVWQADQPVYNPKYDPEYGNRYEEWWNREGKDLDKQRSGPDRKIAPAESFIWRGAQTHKERTRTNGMKGRNKRYFEWDYKHGDIEVFNHDRSHLGTMDPLTGKIIKPPQDRKLPKDRAEIESQTTPRTA